MRNLRFEEIWQRAEGNASRKWWRLGFTRTSWLQSLYQESLGNLNGKKCPEAVVKREREWFVGTGRTEEAKCLMRRGGWRMGEQLGHRDEMSDARTVLLWPDWAWAVMELVEGPSNTDLGSQGLRRGLGAPEKHKGPMWGYLPSSDSRVSRRFFPYWDPQWEEGLEVWTVQRRGVACTPFVIFHLNCLPSGCSLSLKSATWYWS